MYEDVVDRVARGDAEEAQSRADDAYQLADDAIGRVRGLEAQIDDLAHELQKLSSRVADLCLQIEDLETAQPAEVSRIYKEAADFDTVSTEELQRIKEAYRWEELRSQLLGDHTREWLERAINAVVSNQNRVATLEIERDDIRVQLEALPLTRIRERQRLEQDLKRVDAECAQANRDLQKAQSDAEPARRELNEDKQRREKHHSTISAGLAAEAWLDERYKKFARDAVTKAMTVPKWFELVLGRQPSPRHNSERWITAAAALIRYRHEKGERDPVVALPEVGRDDPWWPQYSEVKRLIKHACKPDYE